MKTITFVQTVKSINQHYLSISHLLFFKKWNSYVFSNMRISPDFVQVKFTYHFIGSGGFFAYLVKKIEEKSVAIN